MTYPTNQEFDKNSDFIRRRRLLGGTALMGSLLLMGANMSYAQDTTNTDTTAADDEETQFEEVVVTGSRLRRSGFSSPTPIDVIRTDDALRMGHFDLATALKATTVAAGAPQVTSATSTAFVENGGPGTDTISLRGLGANRTLTLLNGRRAGPAGTRGSVSSFDLNVLPLVGVEQVDILKDGASSIYGSDAVAGVINFITKKDEGGEINAFTSLPTRSGGEVFQVSASYGDKFDRGYYRVTGDYYSEKELAKGDRPWFECGEDYIFDQTTGERADLIDPRTGEYRCSDLTWGHVWTYDYSEFFTDSNLPNGANLIQYDYDGSLAQYLPPFVQGDPYQMGVPEGWFPVGYDPISSALTNTQHPFLQEESLQPKRTRYTVMAEGEYELTDHVTMYAEALFNRRKTYENHYRQYWSYIYNSNFDFYYFDVNDNAGNSLNEGWTGAQWFSPTPITDHNDSSTTIDYYRGVVGFKGDFGDVLPDWRFDTSIQYSYSDAKYWSQIIYQDSLDAGNWLYGSCEGTTTAVRGVACVDVPWLDPDLMAGTVSDEVRAFLFGEEEGSTKYKQYTIDYAMDGPLFDLPAGSVIGAFGFQYQYDKITDTPGEATLAANAWGSGSAGITTGHHNTKAAFGEIDIPLLSGKPMFESLVLNASVRYTDVSSYGDGTTYKLSLNWQVNDTIRFRAGQGTSFRSPALFELFLADETSFRSQRTIDPCYLWGQKLSNGQISQRVADNCAADGLPADHTASISADVLSGGGYGVLKAETSTSKTIGVVLTPSFADLQVSVDYFDIEIRDEVDQLGASSIVFGCYDSEFFPDEPLCDLFDRNSYSEPLPGMITEVRDSFININSQRNRGWDIAATFRTKLPYDINLTVNTQHTIREEDSTETFDGFSTDVNGRIGYPKWVGNLNMTFDKGPWSMTWSMRGVGSASSVEANNGVTSVTYWSGTDDEATYDIVIEVPRVVYHNVSLSYEFEDLGLTLLGGVSNLFDKEPPQVSGVGWSGRVLGRSAFYSQYDWVGRRFFLNLTKRF